MTWHSRVLIPCGTVPKPATHNNTESNSDNPASTPSYLIRTTTLPPSSAPLFTHPLNAEYSASSSDSPIIQRSQVALGAGTNLTRTGVHLCTLAPGKESTVLHWHVAEDEWIWVLSCGEGAKLVTYDESVREEQSLQLKGGDFLGFPAGMKVARKLVNDKEAKEEVRYLVGGSRVEVDVVHYPTIGGGGGKRSVIDRTGNGKRLSVDGEAVDENFG